MERKKIIVFDLFSEQTRTYTPPHPPNVVIADPSETQQLWMTEAIIPPQDLQQTLDPSELSNLPSLKSILADMDIHSMGKEFPGNLDFADDSMQQAVETGTPQSEVTSTAAAAITSSQAAAAASQHVTSSAVTAAQTILGAGSGYSLTSLDRKVDDFMAKAQHDY